MPLLSNKRSLSCSCLYPSSRDNLKHQGVQDRSIQPDSNFSIVCNDGNNMRVGGWRTMPFIMGNEVCERLASIGLSTNLMSYLMKQYHMRQVSAATVHNVVAGTANLTPLMGAFLSDSYLGRYRTIVYASLFNLMGSLFLTVSAISKNLRPAPKDRASVQQLGFLYTAFLFTALGTGGLRPCGYAFGADQFAQENPKERKEIQSFSNWYFFVQYLASFVAATVLVYIQENAGWGWGFGLPAIAMVIAIFVFVMGFHLYRHDPPRGNSFALPAHVIKAAFHKRKVPVASDSNNLYEGETFAAQHNLCHTSQFKFLDRAAVKVEGDIDVDGKLSAKARLCSVTQVEEVKALLRLGPVWISFMLSATALSQHATFIVPEANTTNRHMGKSFQIPAATIHVFATITLIIWIPIYDRLLVPKLTRLTGHPQGFRTLQRVGIGLLISVIGLVVSAIVEAKRREVARKNGFIDKPHMSIPFTVFWFVPQYCIYGLGQVFNSIGQIEFLYDQLPSNMRSMAVAMHWCSFGLGDYAGGVLVQAVHKLTSWLDDNLNRGHLDYFYYILAVLQFVNLLYFVIIARWYTYKEFASTREQMDDPQLELIQKVDALE